MIIRRQKLGAGLMTCLVGCAAVGVCALLLWVLLDIAIRGLPHLSFSFVSGEVENAGRSGGIGPIIWSTAWILLITLALATPISLAAAIDFTEQSSRFHEHARRCLDLLAGVPSIVFGLFGNAFFVVSLGLGYSILSGALTLALMVLPLMIRSFEQAIASVPLDHRLAANALGLSRWATLVRVILPAAAPGLAAGLALSVGRALAETAALIFTAGYVTRSPESPLDSGRSLSVHIFDLAMNVPKGSSNAYATACVLVLMILAINAVTSGLLRQSGLAASARPPRLNP